mgnify:CR=1 FL=1
MMTYEEIIKDIDEIFYSSRLIDPACGDICKAILDWIHDRNKALLTDLGFPEIFKAAISVNPRWTSEQVISCIPYLSGDAAHALKIRFKFADGQGPDIEVWPKKINGHQRFVDSDGNSTEGCESNVYLFFDASRLGR